MHRFESCQNTLPEVENCMQNKPKQLKQRIGKKEHLLNSPPQAKKYLSCFQYHLFMSRTVYLDSSTVREFKNHEITISEAVFLPESL